MIRWNKIHNQVSSRHKMSNHGIRDIFMNQPKIMTKRHWLFDSDLSMSEMGQYFQFFRCFDNQEQSDITMNWEIFPLDSICCHWGEVLLSELFYILNRGGGWNLDRVNYIHLPLCLIVICLNSTLPICNSQPSRYWKPLSPSPWSFGRFSISWEFKVHDIAISLKISPEIWILISLFIQVKV